MRFWGYSRGSVSVFSAGSVGFWVAVNSVFDVIMKNELMIESEPVDTLSSSMPSV